MKTTQHLSFALGGQSRGVFLYRTMAKLKIEYCAVGDAIKNKNRWVSFEVLTHKYSKSIFVDINIFKNIDNEIKYWEDNNVFFTNIDDIKFRCADHLLWTNIISLDKFNHLIKDNSSQLINWQHLNIPKLNDDDKIIKQKNKDSINKTYLMKDKNTGFYKIGKSTNPKFREQTLQSEKPTIKMVKIWEKDIEKELHSLYKSFRVRGEWFNLSNIQLKYICTNF